MIELNARRKGIKNVLTEAGREKLREAGRRSGAFCRGKKRNVSEAVRQRARERLILLNKTRTPSLQEMEARTKRIVLAGKTHVYSDVEKEARRQRAIDANKARVYTPETKEKLRRIWRERIARGLVNTKEQYERTRKRNILMNKQMPRKRTKIEIIVTEILLSLGIPVEIEKLFDGIGVVDFFCPRQSLCIEADGDYWHRPVEVREKDARRDKSLSELGLRVLRLPEHEIMKDRNGVIQKIYAASV